MIHEAYMPVYRCPDFHCVRAGGSTRGSTRGPRGPKKLSVIDQKLTLRERYLFLHFLQGKKGQNKPQNPQN